MIRTVVRHRSVAFALSPRLQKVIDYTAAQGQKNAMALTSGKVSSVQLAEWGHPFGRGPAPHGGRGAMRGTLPRLPINRQTGELQDSYFARAYVSAVGQGYKIGFSSPHQVVLTPGGTRNMVARSFWPMWGQLTHKAMVAAIRAEFGRK